MKLASYNVENQFCRARALILATWANGKEAVVAQQKLNSLFAKTVYQPKDKTRIVALLEALGLDKKDDGGQFAVLRQSHGKLLKRPRAGGIEVVAGGRADWIGWVDLKSEEVNETATRMTARVVAELDPDVLAVVEAESRPALLRFSENLLPEAAGRPFDHVMLIDGNDERGIDVGLMTRRAYPIRAMESHVDDTDKKGERIFSRDAPVYRLSTPSGEELVLIINHFKSKIAGGDERRLKQAQRVRKVYDALRAEGAKLVAAVGDFNDTPKSKPLAPLLKGSGLRDISEHANFDDGADGARPGTFGNGTASQKIDYVLLSCELFERARGGGVFRKGVWAGKNGDIFPERYAEITRAGEAASDHAAIWAHLEG